MFAIFSNSLFFVLAFSGLGQTEVNKSTEKVDLMELNHCFDECGRHCYDQVIFYDWSPDYRRYHVVAWYLVDVQICSTKIPSKKNSGYEVSWRCKNSKQEYQIFAPLYRETWTKTDPERYNMKFFDEKYRRKICNLNQKICLLEM